MTKKNSKPRRKLKVRSNNYFTWNFRTSDYAYAKKYAAKKGMSMVELGTMLVQSLKSSR
jgi:hypothetical protein